MLESEADLDPVLDTGSPAQEETDLDEVLSSRPGLTEQGSTDLDAVLGVEGVPVVEGAVGSDIDSSTVVGRLITLNCRCSIVCIIIVVKYTVLLRFVDCTLHYMYVYML